MASIQDVFFTIQDIKKQQREIRKMYTEALDKASDYQDVTDQLAALREKKKIIEQKIKSEFSRELDKLDDLKDGLKAEQERMSMMVLDQLAKGEIIKVRDSYNNSYDPIVKVSFKKSDESEH
ncbi:hypothetical protein HY620_03135 [Candidatus Uhrbacteria bacterium]|nr:hypothetical protein [Candidatus Uhrbacteria bacterium]